MATRWLGQPQNMARFAKYLSPVPRSSSEISNVPTLSTRSTPRKIPYASSGFTGNAPPSRPDHAIAPSASARSFTTSTSRNPALSTRFMMPKNKFTTCAFTPSIGRSPPKAVQFTNSLTSTSPSRRPQSLSSFRTGCSRSMQAPPSGRNIMWSAQRWGDLDCPTRESLASRRKALWSAYESGIVMALEAARVYDESLDPDTDYGRTVLVGQTYLSSKLGAREWGQRLDQSR